MKRTRRVNKRHNKTRAKRGGAKKNNQNMASLTTQMVGGQTPQPAPAPSPASVNMNLDYSSVVRSLQTFGETVWNLKDATALGEEAANERLLAAQADQTALRSLNTATAALYNAFFGTKDRSGNTITQGLFGTIVPAATFIAPASASPAPR